jgi:putative protein kinase ArgK-like GTPase of G3E family
MMSGLPAGANHNRTVCMTTAASSAAVPRRGRFIALDGIDGAGKSSQIAALVDWLRAGGRTVVTCRDPGSTPAGDAIRAILLDRHDLHVDPTERCCSTWRRGRSWWPRS